MSQPKKLTKVNLRSQTVAKQEPEQKETKEREVKKVVFRIKGTAKRQLDKLAFDNETTKQNLFNEAMNLLFERYNKPQLMDKAQ